MKNLSLILMLVLSSTTAFADPSAEKDYFVNANIGAFKNFSSFNNDFQFAYGGKAAARITRLEGFSNLWAALAVNRTSSNPTGLITTSITEVMLQPLFTNIGDCNFYFSPQIGFNFIGLGANTTTEFTYGVLAGWMFPINESWSIVPEANLTRFSNLGASQTALKFLAGVNFAF